MSGQTRRKVCKSGRLASTVTLPEVLALQHLPIELAAAEVGVCVTTFKKVCRKLGIQRWPFRSGAARGCPSSGHLPPLVPPQQPFQLTQLPTTSQAAPAAAAGAGSPSHADKPAQASGTLSTSSGASDFARAPPALVQPPGPENASQQLGQLLQALAGAGGPLGPSLHHLAGEHLLQQAAAAAAAQQQQAAIAEMVLRMGEQAAGPAAPTSGFMPLPVPSAALAPMAQLQQLLQGGAWASLSAALQPAPQASSLDTAGVLQQLAALQQPQLAGGPDVAAAAAGHALLAQLAQLAAPRPAWEPAPAAAPAPPQHAPGEPLLSALAAKQEGSEGASQLLAAIMGTLVTAV